MKSTQLICLLASSFLLLGCPTDPAPSNNGSNNGATNNGQMGSCEVGTRSCQDARTLSTCVRNSDGTTRTITTTCLDSETCMNGDCEDIPRNCDDTCTPPETRCTTMGQVESCADHDGNGCVEFGAARACDQGQICDPTDGLCRAPTCTDACNEGETSCEDELITTCTRGVEGCLEWGPGKECPETQVCSNGACEASTTCQDECVEGETLCTADGMYQVCVRDADADNCTELQAAQACPATQTCRQGSCVPEAMCQDQCLAGEKVCVGNSIASCETTADGCLDFSAPTACPGANETCQNNGGTVACGAVQVSGKVVVNEVFYDALGDDTRGADGSPTFVELFGPPGLPLANFTVELVNGSGGAVYGTFTLPADAKLDGYGFAVITTDTPDTFLSLALPFFSNVYPIMTGASGTQDVLQNGPDNVRLLDANGTEVDAVTYGATDALGFAGEGTCTDAMNCDSAPDPSSGRSVGRDANGTDTDNNKADFLSYFPTPGLPNADLIINEAYVDQPGADGSDTFVELMAPIQGWENLALDGYVLRAINGNNGEDYIFTTDNMGNPTLNGIYMDGYTIDDGVANDYGYAVVCNVDTVGAALIDYCSVLYEGVDYQNGPDSFVLEYNGRVIDALGYGTFSATDTFAGEGTAVPFSPSDAGKSLSRWPIFDVSRDLDTDNNSADFFKVSPTPGTDNELPNP